MAKKTRKRVTMLVTVSIPAQFTAAMARREVASNVREQCMYALDEGEVKLIGIRPAGRSA